MLQTVTAETFSPHVGDSFQLHLSPGTRIPVTLIAAEERPAVAAATPGRTPFSLLFRPPSGVIPGQRTYRLEHDTIGTLDIFLVPVTPDADGPRLEAIFS
jgi:hypothetical protein